VAEDPSHWRDIGELGALVGHYAWLEEQLFELTGAWASGELHHAESQVWCAAVSRHHGMLAARWAERLPVRAGVDAGALIRAPSEGLADAFAALSEVDDVSVGVAVVARSVLPWLGETYLAHHRVASAVSEAPVSEVLMEARRIITAETTGGQSVVRNLGDESELQSSTGDLVTYFARITDKWCVFPAVRTS
jgi:hypothetical protein